MAGPLRVLLVEDNPGDARLVEISLEESRRWRFETEATKTLGEAAAAAETRAPDVVLLDLTLPDGEGLELFRRARDTFDAPLVLVTGRQDDELVEALAAEGAQDYLVKGRFDADVLCRAVVSARERHDLVRALHRREREVRTILENTPDIVARFDRDGRCLYVNGALERELGISRRSVLGRRVSEIDLGSERRIRLERALERVFDGQETAQLEQSVETSRGDVRWFQARLVPEPDETGAVQTVLVTARDVTSRVLMQRRLETTAAALRERVKESESLYAVSRILYDVEEVEEALPEVAELLPPGFQFSEIAGARIVLEGQEAQSDRFTESPWRLRQDLSVNGEPIGFVEVSYSEERPELDEGPFLLEERMLLGAAAERLEEAVRRTRARRRMDETQSRLRRARSLEAMGQLAGGLAHDFNNLLTTISGYTELLLLPTVDEEARSDLEEIRSAAEKAGHLTRQLLAFGRRQVLQPRILDLGEVVEAMREMLGRIVGEDVRLLFDLPDEPIPVEADRGQLEEVLVGLAAFVRGELTDGGVMTVRVEAVEADGRREGLVAVADDGPGLAPEALEQIFDPFFTSRELGFGWGLGLASVHGIVNQSGGRISVDSGPGEGTTFEIRFPIMESREKPEEVRRESRESPLTGKKVLVIEDDRAVRNLVARTLGSHGYQVETAVDGREGLRKASRLRRDLALVVTDVVMPEIRGPELARRLAGVAGAVPILFMSGYAEQELDASAVLGCRAFLQKPFAARDLLARVEHLLSSDSRRGEEAS